VWLVRLTGVALSVNQIKLTWLDNSDNETLFKIERSTDGKTFYALGAQVPNVTNYVNGNLAAGRRYYYRVFAINANGASTYSNVFSTTTLIA